MPSRSVDDRVSSLYGQANNSFRELVAFDEVIMELSSRPKAAAVEEWMDNYSNFLDRNSDPVFYDNMGRFINMLGRVLAKADPDDQEGTYRMTTSDEGLGVAFESFMTNLMYRFVNRAEMIGRAILIAAESSFEVLFGQLAHVIYAKYPSALSSSDYSFTLDELTKYTSIEDARESLIRRRIDSLLRESLNGWDKWLKRTINVSIEQALPNWPATCEIFIRRNMLVHTDGRITERYLNELQQSGGSIEGLEIGESLGPTVEYLRTSLQRLIALEVILLFQVVSRIEKNRLDAAAEAVSDKLEFCVTRRMWEAACLISDSFDDTKCKREIQLAIRVNGWLAHKFSDGIDRIRNEVFFWDVSGLHEKYVIIKDLLLDKLTTEELAAAVEGGIFSNFEVSTHPLFERFKQPESKRRSDEVITENQNDTGTGATT
jgi:hypothetical protein